MESWETILVRTGSILVKIKWREQGYAWSSNASDQLKKQHEWERWGIDHSNQ
jgi:hypothetical protein